MFERKDHAESQGGIPIGAGEMDRRVLDSPGGRTQADVNDRRDNVGDTDISKENPITASLERCATASRYSDHAIFIRPVERRALRRRYDELQQLVAVRLGTGKGLKGWKRKTTQKVAFGAHDSKTCRDATAPSDLRGPATAVRDGTETGRQISTEGGSDYGPKHEGNDGIAAEVAGLSVEEARRALTVIASITNVRFYFLEILVLPLSNHRRVLAVTRVPRTYGVLSTSWSGSTK
ncbi:hypothetical protein EDD15DRAFT_713613 [Pisolithus albus]|nr:hypothetical protein EDD15DRAFT_713613 [Pisolithus albus]